jgi:Na+-driven multidrug efflux pump
VLLVMMIVVEVIIIVMLIKLMMMMIVIDHFVLLFYCSFMPEGVKLVTRLLPYIGMLIPFWGIYSQMSTAFQNQGG